MLRLHALLAGFCLLLAACAARTPVPAEPPRLALPLSLHIQRQAEGSRQDWLLVLQAEGRALRWSLFDPLGVPLARQRLERGAWQDDGLLPPNAEARELFAALLFALTPDESLARTYPQTSRTADGRQLVDWRVKYRAAHDFSLERQEGPRYQVTALPVGEAS